MTVYSVVLALVAWRLGIDRGVGTAGLNDLANAPLVHVPGYFEKTNWLLFPVYWPIIWLLSYFLTAAIAAWGTIIPIAWKPLFKSLFG